MTATPAPLPEHDPGRIVQRRAAPVAPARTAPRGAARTAPAGRAVLSEPDRQAVAILIESLGTELAARELGIATATLRSVALGAPTNRRMQILWALGQQRGFVARCDRLVALERPRVCDVRGCLARARWCTSAAGYYCDDHAELRARGHYPDIRHG